MKIKCIVLMLPKSSHRISRNAFTDKADIYDLYTVKWTDGCRSYG